MRYLLFFLFIPGFLVSQQTIQGDLMHDGEERDYLLYIPANYSGNEDVPLVINFHGYQSSNVEQIAYGDFRPIADTAGFILVVPQGLQHEGNTHWNVGGWIINSPVDDVDFTAELINHLASNYSINTDRVYATGMSNGGFMSFLLACQLGDKIAAIASVTGSMTPSTFNECNPTHPTPVLQIHGDSDSVVPYNGAIWTKSVSETVEYWKNFNQCEDEAILTILDDIDVTDGSTVERYVYENMNNHAVVEHYKVLGGDHTWPGTIFDFGGTNQDINASEKIWQFFAQYDLNGKITVSQADYQTAFTWSIFPNPSQDRLYFNGVNNMAEDLKIYDQKGSLIILNKGIQTPSYLDISPLKHGMYFIELEGQVQKFIKL